MVVRLAVLAEVANERHRELGVVDPVLLRAAFAERAAVEADDRGMAEVAVDAVEAGRVRHRHIGVVGPGHGFRHHHLLLLGRIHVALAAHDELRAAHRAVAPDLRIVAVVADDQADLEALRPLGDVGAVARIPALDRHPRHDLAVLLNDLALVVHQDQRVVRRLVRVLLMTLAGQRKHAPALRFPAGVREDLGLLARDRGGGVVHLLGVVHDPVGRIFGEDHEVHAGQARLHAHHHVGDRLGVLKHLGLGVQPGHLVVHDRHADGVLARSDIAVKHVPYLLRWPGARDRGHGAPAPQAVAASRRDVQMR